jgi:hypothetical protein
LKSANFFASRQKINPIPGFPRWQKANEAELNGVATALERIRQRSIVRCTSRSCAENEPKPDASLYAARVPHFIVESTHYLFCEKAKTTEKIKEEMQKEANSGAKNLTLALEMFDISLILYRLKKYKLTKKIKTDNIVSDKRLSRRGEAVIAV